MELAALSYPLNVYALLLAWETGTAEHLHYGHFEYPEEAVEQAQARAVELLRSHLPPQGKILEVGCGFGGLTHQLRQAGYDITGITPDSAQIMVAHSRHGTDLPVRCIRLEDFHEAEGSWDLLLFHESGQYVAMLDLFARAAALLKHDGKILVLDEFACKRCEPGLENLHHKDHFLALAERFGFTCLKEIDCTAAAAPTLDFLVRTIESHREALTAATGVGAEELAQLIASNQAYRKKYQNGRFGYFLLQLQRQAIPRWHLAQITEHDYPAVNSLFSEVFAHPLSIGLWLWKYGPDTGGGAIGLWQDGELVAHYGGMIRRFYWDGEIKIASQSCDVMVAPHARGSLLRKGPLFLTCATYLEQFVGYGRPYPFAYGFPNDRAYRLPYKLGLYSEPMTRVNSLSWSASRYPYRMWDICPLDMSNQSHSRIVDSLWGAMMQDLGHLVVGVRDADYLACRYQRHPQNAYRLVLVYHRLWRSPLAALVVKQESERMELLDWVAPLRHFSKVVEAGRLLAGQSDVRELYLWASEPTAALLSATCPQVEDLNILVPANAWTSGPPLSSLKDRLWLTGGDTDFH